MLDVDPSESGLKRRFDALAALVGRTPLLALGVHLDGARYRVFAKLETLNPTGSVKDRMALHILRRAHESGELTPGATIVEATSGNTGIAFAALGRALGHTVRIYMPDWMSRERVQLMTALGADVVPVSKEQGGFQGSIRLAATWADTNARSFQPRQFDNAANVEAHERSTGPEILAQLAGRGLSPSAFVAGVGTGGTVMGVGRALRAACSDVRIHPLEPSNSPTLRTGRRVGSHRIQGISDEFVPSIVDLSVLDEIIDVDDGDAILCAQRLARELGLGVGISSGANFLGAVEIARRLGPEAVVVTVFPDSNKKYLSTALFGDEPKRAGFLSPRLSFEDFDAIA